jgi:type II secretory pathway pseudopilin PulG
MTLIELMLAIILISITSVAGIDVMTDTLNEGRFRDTKTKLVAIRNALVGDPSLTAAGVRSSFGYQGDIGGIPSSAQGLAALWTMPSGFSAYAIDSGSRIGVGWNGPYLNVTSSGVDYTIDGWGNSFVYNPTASPPTVVSLGADGAAGGTGYNQDITMELPSNVTNATVFGVIVDNGAVWNQAADIVLNEPNGSGVIQTVTTSVVAGNNGAFSFTGIPIGIRSLTVYVGSQASPTQTLGPIVFSITSNMYLIPPKMIDLGL